MYSGSLLVSTVFWKLMDVNNSMPKNFKVRLVSEFILSLQNFKLVGIPLKNTFSSHYTGNERV